MSVRKSSRQEILVWFQQQPDGATVDACAEKLGFLNNTASAHISRLVAAGQLQATPKKRMTRSGRPAVVYQYATQKTVERHEVKNVDGRVLAAFRRYKTARQRNNSVKSFTRAVHSLVRSLDVLL